MPDHLSIHEPILVNTIGHCAGVLIFGILLYLFVKNWPRSREARNFQPALAAALAMLWNIGSLIALATEPANGELIEVVAALSFSVLSLLPAVLLRISLGAEWPVLGISGYVLSAIAIGLHLAELFTHSERYHYSALLLVTIGFGILAAVSVFLKIRERNQAAGSRLAGAMGLFLFAISFVHFGSADPRQMWEGEIAVHHAGLPLALLVLLQDYRFLLLDTFLRFILNAVLGAGALLLSLRVLQSPNLSPHLQHPFDAGLLFVAGCVLLILFVYLRNEMQRLLTRVLFLRSNVEEPLAALRDLGHSAADEQGYLSKASAIIAGFLSADRQQVDEASADFVAPVAVLDAARWGVPAWVQAIVPLRFARGDTKALLLGGRKGGRRYLSEDLTILARLATAVVEHVEQLRESQMQALVTQAELRALQAQINPHFFFNALNTLYGTIARENAEARQLVLNLADLFRYFLNSDRTFIQVAEELKIVRSYLAIEELRLGSKFKAYLDVDEDTLTASIPVLSIQPLVENAVKHGIAARSGEGFVRLSVHVEGQGIAVAVTNSGEWPRHDELESSAGIGLANVRRRLELCFGEASHVEVTSGGGITTVRFRVPVAASLETAHAWD